MTKITPVSFCCLYCWLWTCFTPFSDISFVYFMLIGRNPNRTHYALFKFLQSWKRGLNKSAYVKSVRIRSYSGPHFSRIFPHLDWRRGDTPYAGKCEKNADQNNSEYGCFLRSAGFVGFVQIDLLKVYDSLPYDFQIGTQNNRSLKVINNLNVAKTCQVNDIPAKVIPIIKMFLLISLRTTSITVLLIVNFLMN